MADKNDDKKQPPKPVARYTVGGDKDKKGSSTPKPPPQPVARRTVGGDAGAPQPPQPVARYKTGEEKKPAPPSRPAQPGAAGGRPVARPSERAARHQANVKANPMPTPPQRRVVRPGAVAGAGAATAAAGAAAVGPEIQSKINTIVSKYERLETQSQLAVVYDTIGRIDAKLTELPFKVEKMRERGYVHARQLEAKLVTLEEKWDGNVRPRVETGLKEQIERLDKELEQAEVQVKRINGRVDSTVRGAETAVDSLERRINSAQSTVSALYQGVENEVNEIERRIEATGKMLDLLDGAPGIRLRDAEGPLLAVETEWHRDGKEGPKGFLFLTDQRLIFEQREEIVTKKKFGLFKADSEKIQEVHIDVEVHQIESVAHKEEGGFMGMGKADILELVFAASANIARARLHLKGQNSSDWAAIIKRIQTGDIDKDRSDKYVEALQTAGITSASFPAQCPNCYGTIPTQPRGVTSYTCEFCGVVVSPQT